MQLRVGSTINDLKQVCDCKVIQQIYSVFITNTFELSLANRETI